MLLIFDGHHSHISLELIELARENNIHLLCLPPHTTHLLQPLDVGVFGPLKQAWKKILKEHQIETCACTVTKEDFPRPHFKALGTGFQSSTHQEWISKDRVASLV